MKPPIPSEQAALQKAMRSLAAARQDVDKFPEFAASRAYYAMFYSAAALLYQRGKRFKTHNGLLSAFGLEFAKDDPSWQTIMPGCARLSDTRSRPTTIYLSSSTRLRPKAREIIGWAEEFLEATWQELKL